jgi:LmbE family N-acetylglucosaminyl deacetylase
MKKLITMVCVLMPILVGVFILSVSGTRISAQEETKPFPGFDAHDRVLIFAPHPDDESIGAAGVLQQAEKAGAKAKVVCLTNGDHNELAFIVYEKRLTFRKGEFIHMGEVRRKETLAAMQSLHVDKKDIVFLGYPDFGTLKIFSEYWGDTRPFKDFLTRLSNVPYPECLSVNASYVGESILKDLKTVLVEFKPTKIFVSHPLDMNRDHRALYLFLQVALWDLDGKISRPEVFPYLIHVLGWPSPRGYHPDIALSPPKKFKEKEIFWKSLGLSRQEVEKKHAAISFYKSQIEYAPAYLFTFARKNELFGDYPAIVLKKQKAALIRWQDAAATHEDGESAAQKTNFAGLSYALEDGNIRVKIGLKRKIDKELGVAVFLFGYRKNTAFARMPKIRINLGIGGISIRDKRQRISGKFVQVTYEGNSLILTVPLNVLGNPHYMLACARASAADQPFDETAWRIIAIK